MRAALIGRLLLVLGLLVGAAASIGLLVGFEPARLPPVLLNIAAYKLTFVAALGLFAGGAVFLRHARREEMRESARRDEAGGIHERAPRMLPPEQSVEPGVGNGVRRAGQRYSVDREPDGRSP